MCKLIWLCLLALAALPSAPVFVRAAELSVCEVRNAMSATCPCIWSAMIYNLSPDTRTAVVEQRSRTVFPSPGEWTDGRRMILPLHPWQRQFIGCYRVGKEVDTGACGYERAWTIVSCEAVKEHS